MHLLVSIGYQPQDVVMVVCKNGLSSQHCLVKSCRQTASLRSHDLLPSHHSGLDVSTLSCELVAPHAISGCVHATAVMYDTSLTLHIQPCGCTRLDLPCRRVSIARICRKQNDGAGMPTACPATTHGLMSKSHWLQQSLCQDNVSSSQSQNVYFDSKTSSLHWKSKLKNVWGQCKRVSTLWRCFRTSGQYEHAEGQGRRSLPNPGKLIGTQMKPSRHSVQRCCWRARISLLMKFLGNPRMSSVATCKTKLLEHADVQSLFRRPRW